MNDTVQSVPMRNFTVIAYVLPAGGHHVEEVTADDATEAAITLRTRLGLTKEEFEIVLIANGPLAYAEFDVAQLALAPFSPASP